jgi:hypothetical protein
MMSNIAAGALGGLIGQIGDIFSEPRKRLWSAVGLPESGAKLVSDVTGLDQGGALAQSLGAGVEVLGDPLTFALGLFGPRLVKAAIHPWQEEARLKSILQTGDDVMNLEKQVMNQRAADIAAIERQQLARAPELEALPLPTIVNLEQTHFPKVRPDFAAATAVNQQPPANVASALGELVNPADVNAGMHLYGNYYKGAVPAATPGVAAQPTAAALAAQQAHKAMYDFPPGMKMVPGGRGGGSSLWLNQGTSLPAISPDEMALLRGGLPGLSPSMTRQEIADALLRHLINQQVAALPPVRGMGWKPAEELTRRIPNLPYSANDLAVMPIDKAVANVVAPEVAKAQTLFPRYKTTAGDYLIPGGYLGGSLLGSLLYALTRPGE